MRMAKCRNFRRAGFEKCPIPWKELKTVDIDGNISSTFSTNKAFASELLGNPKEMMRGLQKALQKCFLCITCMVICLAFSNLHSHNSVLPESKRGEHGITTNLTLSYFLFSTIDNFKNKFHHRRKRHLS